MGNEAYIRNLFFEGWKEPLGRPMHRWEDDNEVDCCAVLN
jgi:hypothetical protein